MPIEIYANLLNKALCIVGNSSSAIRDGSFVGTPAVNIGTRQNARLRAKNVLDVGYKEKEIYSAIIKLLNKKKFKRSYLYGRGDAAIKIVNILKKLKKKLKFKKKLITKKNNFFGFIPARGGSKKGKK